MIFDLPEFILLIVQGLLTLRAVSYESQVAYAEECEYRLFYEEPFEEDELDDRGWRNLMNTTKLVKELKRKTIYLVLKDSFALLYMNDELFRQRVDGLVLNRRDQLYLSFRQDVEEPFIIRNGSWDGCNTVRLQDLNSVLDFSIISSVKILRLYSSMENVAIYNLSGTETLELNNCDTIEVISNCPRLTRLRVNNCSNLRDISDLTNLITLYVAGCSTLTIQEKTFQSVQFLWLGDKANSFPRYNINCFKNLKYLTLADKTLVKDEIWQLDNLFALQFLNCNNIKVSRFPKSLRNLVFCEYTTLPPFNSTPMPSLKTLAFNNVYKIEVVIDFPQPLRELLIINCSALRNIYLYSSVQYLFIDLIDKGSEESSNASDSVDFHTITVWIGPGIPAPNVTLKGFVEFRLKRMA